MKYEELVKALRIHASVDIECYECAYYDDCCINGNGHTKMMSDAAAAIEELDAEETRLLMITSELQDKVVELEEELNDVDIAADDNARQVEELQARLCEAENSVERWKDMYLTKHEPKRGEWSEENRRPRSSQFVCSVCHRTAYDPQPTRDKAWRKRCRYSYCPNCGAKMGGME